MFKYGSIIKNIRKTNLETITMTFRNNCKKYSRIIELLAKKANISKSDALEVFYKSITYKEMSQGISDMHCRSDEYLVREIMDELSKAK